MVRALFSYQFHLKWCLISSAVTDHERRYVYLYYDCFRVFCLSLVVHESQISMSKIIYKIIRHSVWIHIFDDQQWDLFAKGNAYDPIHDTPLHREPRSGVTVFKILVSTSIEESLLFVIIKLWLNFEKLHNRQKLLVQESWSDPVASHMVFGLVENEAMNWIITRGDLGYIHVIRWGFTVFPLDVYPAPVKLLAYLIKTNAKK